MDSNFRPSPNKLVSMGPSYNPDMLRFPTQEAAQSVIMRLQGLVAAYGYAACSDLADACDVRCNFEDERWGWTDLRGSAVKATDSGYALVLPKALFISGNYGPPAGTPYEKNTQYGKMQGLHPTQYIEDEVQNWPEDLSAPAQDWVNTHNYGRHSVQQPRRNTRNERTAPSRTLTQRRNRAKLIRFCAIFSGVALVVLVMGLLLMGNSSTKTDNGAVTQVSQPADAAAVAKSLGCTDFHTIDASNTIGGTVSAGWCMKGGVKYAINTFMTQAIRDSWLSGAERLGVVPKWETATSVTYKSVN